MIIMPDICFLRTHLWAKRSSSIISFIWLNKPLAHGHVVSVAEQRLEPMSVGLKSLRSNSRGKQRQKKR